MKVTYVCDEQKGPGYGYLACSGESFAPGNYGLCLQRAVDKCFLSPLCEKADERWIESRTVFDVPGTLSEQGELLLPLDPRVVNLLSTQDTYRLSLITQGDKPLLAQFRIESITYSAEDSLNNAQVMAAPKTPEPVVAASEPMPEVLPCPAPKPEESAKRGKKPLLFVLASLLLLALAGFLAWFYLRQEVPPEPATVVTPLGKEAQGETAQSGEGASGQESDPLQQALPQPAPGQEDNPLEQALPKPAPGQEDNPLQQALPEPAPGQEDNPLQQTLPEPLAQPAPETSPKPSPVLSVEDQVQTFFADRERTAARAVELSQSLAHNSPSEQDAVFRLYYFAAEHGERKILLDYAACFDPARPAWGTIEKDALEAYRLYEEAKAELPEAQTRQNELKSWLEEAAKGGNAQARMWLSQLPK
ncbi:MAG: hypothetical protein J5846_07210 [Desulfovibrio sp.]|nr:hypothetical protein [Desulfovibrio sp.]